MPAAGDAVEVGPLTVFFPRGSERSFWFSEDLTELLGVEVNADAEARLRAALGERPPGRLGFDTEADAVLVRASNPDLLRHVLLTLRALSVDPEQLPVDVIEAGVAAMRAAPRPRRQRWAVGDVFGVPLADGTFTAGQVVDTPGPRLGATLALMDHPPRAALAADELEEIVTARTVTILHTTAADLDDGTFPVIGRGPVLVDPDSGPQGPVTRGHSWDGIGWMANAWWGLYPWDGLADPRALDKMLTSGLSAPDRAWRLTPAEREDWMGPDAMDVVARRVASLRR